jgi:exo-beta-1,3-glucanase (GH17 family)
MSAYGMHTLIFLLLLLVGCGGDGSSGSSFNPIHGLNLGVYVDDQKPGYFISEDQLRARMELVAPYARWIRTYGSMNGLEEAGRIAHEMGLKAAIGAWLDGSGNDAQEINNLIAAGKAGHVDLAVVGSEVLRVMSLGPDSLNELIGYIGQVRAALPGIPVTTAETADTLLDYEEVVEACDVVFFNHYPYWEGVPIEEAVENFARKHDELKSKYPEKELIVSEVGWPTCGNTVGGAVPSLDNQRRSFREFVAWARANGVQYFWFEAFNEAWKAEEDPDAPQESCFGVYPIEITDVDLSSTPGSVRGRTWNVIPSRSRVAVYIYVPDWGWASKPFLSNRLTGIGDGGGWAASLPERTDSDATKVRAYLVPDGYQPPEMNGGEEITDEMGLLIHSYDMDEWER